MTYKHRILTAFSLFIAALSVVRAQTDTTEYLFKKAQYRYMQFHFGYSPMFFSNGQVAHGYSSELLGVVFNDKLALGLDFDGFAKNPPYTILSYPYVSSWLTMSLSIEPLIRPRKVINFSFPIKLGYGGASIYRSTATMGTTLTNPQFFVCNPQAMVWVNLLKPLSFGTGASYRLCFGKDPDSLESFGGASIYATLRLKFYTKEYMEKAMQRQKEWFNAHPAK